MIAPIPNFKPLSRRKTVYFRPRLLDKIGPYIFCLFLLKVVGIALFKPHQSKGLRAVLSILSLFLCCLVGMAAIGLMGNTLGRRPLSYRAWLLSFNEDYEMKELPWWDMFIRNANDEYTFL